VKGFCTATSLFLLASPAAAFAADYAHFPTYAANGWTVTDKGEERCNADFSVDGDTLLGFMGPYHFRPGEPASGSIIHLADESDYKLPKGDKHGEFPAELVAGAARFTVLGFATDLGGSLVVDSGSMPTVIDLLAALPDNITLSATVEGKQIYAIALTGNRGAAKALQDCTAFITAQKRPGTKNGPKLGLPKPPQLEILSEPTPERLPDRVVDVPPMALPEAGPPEALPRSR
jgi:hypothetical protein